MSDCILVVDDQEYLRRILYLLLEKEGYEVLLAENGKDALRKVEQQLPDLILMDVMMPELDGFATARIMHENPALRRVPIIFLTARDGLADRLVGFDVGADDYIAKPFDNDELLIRIESRLAKTQQVRNDEENVRAETISQVIVTLAHYINNSLAVLQGRAQMVDPKDPDSSAKLVETVIKHCAKIRTVVESLEEMAITREIVTADYVGMKDAMLDIAQRLEEKINKNFINRLENEGSSQNPEQH